MMPAMGASRGSCGGEGSSVGSPVTAAVQAAAVCCLAAVGGARRNIEPSSAEAFSPVPPFANQRVCLSCRAAVPRPTTALHSPGGTGGRCSTLECLECTSRSADPAQQQGADVPISAPGAARTLKFNSAVQRRDVSKEGARPGGILVRSNAASKSVEFFSSYLAR